MKYTFYGYDYFTGNGEYDFSSEHYHALMKCCMQYCEAFSLIVATENAIGVKELEQWLIWKPSWPYQNESHMELRRFYRLCPQSMDCFQNIAPSIFSMFSPDGYTYPEDPVFYRGDGSVFLDAIVHEWECSIYPEAVEDVSSVLAFGHWLQMAGGSVFQTGTAHAPAKNHLPPIPPEWNTPDDLLYTRMLEIRSSPEDFLSELTPDSLCQYLDSFRRSISHVPNFPYCPKWYVAFQLYLQSRCDAMTDDPIPDALKQAGYEEAEGVKQFFALLDEFIDQAAKQNSHL